MTNIIRLFLVSLLFSSCATLKKQQASDWILLYKKQAFSACNKEGNSKFPENDISRSINFDVIGDAGLAKRADSLGRTFYNTILPSPILDYESKKPVCNSCLDYFLSKELDNAAKKAHKEYLSYRRSLKKI